MLHITVDGIFSEAKIARRDDDEDVYDGSTILYKHNHREDRRTNIDQLVLFVRV
jgi:hypothetical protein